ALTCYYAFAGGTRNVVATYMITFAGAYFLARPQIKMAKVFVMGGTMLALLMVGSIYMLEFRGEGLGNFSFEERHYDTLFIDQNIVNISQLTQAFPDLTEFLGFEVPLNALIRPIPRALWPDKPEGMSMTIEAALGASGGTTLSCTFVGE